LQLEEVQIIPSTMARANMLVSDELRQEFMTAQASSETRWLIASVKDVHINFVSLGPASTDLSADIERLRDVLGKAPMFILFCMDPTLPTKSWILVAYVPEMARVREKMLYATARDDVKNSLGSSHFKGECHLSEPVSVYLSLSVALICIF
jgi:twinfilin-like protein